MPQMGSHFDTHQCREGIRGTPEPPGVAFWDLARLDEKPRFCKLRGQVQCIDAYEEALLVLGKGRPAAFCCSAQAQEHTS